MDAYRVAMGVHRAVLVPWCNNKDCSSHILAGTAAVVVADNREHELPRTVPWTEVACCIHSKQSHDVRAGSLVMMKLPPTS